MKIQRFFALTAREALSLVREALGPDAIILSNRNVANGVEILASDERGFNSAVEESQSPTPILKKAVPNQAAPKTTATSAIVPDNDMNLIMNEIKAMRGSLESQIALLTWNDQHQRYPSKSGILRELVAMGFSASLSRYLAKNAPLDKDIEQGLEWAKGILLRNLSVLKNEDEILDQGGIYALVGPTGVGKTTTTAKLAARCVMRHGPSKLALITTDSYRIGAHEQLRIYGKILGVMVHTVRDEADLRIALDELKNKHIVLIDTVGMSQRDQMVSEQIAMLSGTRMPIKRLLCLNTTSTIETLNEVTLAYRGSGLAGCILTKLDEAVTLSNALDVVLRYKLKLFYVGIGQRVPEDLQMVEPDGLLERTFEHRHSRSATRYEDHELAVLMAYEATRQNSDMENFNVT
ncbi:flagellar biosynthesis protein FlhF [Methylobacter psychrophilus]|uniref:flagellar biosynthesis protein FlhF n=1 Tax=Methylobacter psychrophilus TaxID=96941 RepID=UPI0021D4BEDD|nr:flagellar biosynthesis protein FlhF [Methylobacter psychrophilus]